MKNRICITCGKEFAPSSNHKSCPKCRYNMRKVPCPICGKPTSPDYNLCIECSNNGNTGSNNGNWKGGVSYSSSGYRMIRQPNHPRVSNKKNKYIMEHILVMEESLGRYLFDDETVHHINGIKDDNRLENLELWTGNHPTGCRVSDLLEWARDFINKYGAEQVSP